MARRIRITGIVGEANRIRQALSGPVTPARRDALAQELRDSIDRIDALLRQHNASPKSLPAPSRRAYQFLKQLDLGSVELLETAEKDGTEGSLGPESVRFPGLRAFLDRVLDDISLTMEAGRFNPAATLGVIRRTAERLDYVVRRDGLQAEHLKPEPRGLLGWFRLFADEEAFDLYAQAVRRARSVLARLPIDRPGWRLPLLLHYRPSSHIYRWRVFHDATRIVLPTPMITFDDETLRRLGRQMLGSRRHRPAITAAMLAEAYQAVALELEAAAGIVEQTRGLAHDLADSFKRVSRQYFDHQLARPKLTWSRSLAGRTFGHYDFVHDLVCIASTLDRPEVPAFVVDHVMHHELLHKKHGFKWRGCRQHTHTPEFCAEERTFQHYKEAAGFLDSLSANTP